MLLVKEIRIVDRIEINNIFSYYLGYVNNFDFLFYIN